MTDIATVEQPKTNAQHSMKSAEWYTPYPIVEAMRQLFKGEYILDPASCELANTVVQADSYFDKETDGLILAWCHFTDSIKAHPSSIFLNPPGGKLNNVSMPRLFWEKLNQEIADGHVNHAIYVAYSIEQLQQLQNAGIGNCVVCIPPSRTRYLKLNEAGELKPMKSPTHAGAYVYVPGIIDNSAVFAHYFGSLGAIYKPFHRN